MTDTEYKQTDPLIATIDGKPIHGSDIVTGQRAIIELEAAQTIIRDLTETGDRVTAERDKLAKMLQAFIDNPKMPVTEREYIEVLALLDELEAE